MLYGMLNTKTSIIGIVKEVTVFFCKGLIPQYILELILLKYFLKINPSHVIFTGYAQIPFITGIFWLAKNNIPVVQWYESHDLSSRMKGIGHLLRQYLSAEPMLG